MSKRFICDELTSDYFSDWLKEKRQVDSAIDEKKKFIQRQLEEMEVQRSEVWERLFKRFQEDGLISKDYKYETTMMSVSNDAPIQLFIEVVKDLGPKIGDFINMLTGKKP